MSYPFLSRLSAALHLNPKGSAEATDFNEVFDGIAKTTNNITRAVCTFGRRVWAISSDAVQRFVRSCENDLPKDTELWEHTVALENISQATNRKPLVHCPHPVQHNILGETLKKSIGQELFNKLKMLAQHTKEQLPLPVVAFISEIKSLGQQPSAKKTRLIDGLSAHVDWLLGKGWPQQRKEADKNT